MARYFIIRAFINAFLGFMMKIQSVVVAIFVLLGCLGAKEMRVFGNHERYPKVWKEEGKTKGILVDMLKLMEKDLNITFSPESYPWVRTYNLALSGQGAIMGFSKTIEREELFDYSDAMFYDEIFIIVAKDRSFKFEKIEDLRGKKLGYCRGCSFGKVFEDSKQYFIPVEVDDSKFQSLKLLSVGRIDGLILAYRDEALKKTCTQSSDFKYEDFEILDKPLTRDPNYLGISKKLHQKTFLKEFNRVLKEKIKSGEVDKIVEKYIK